MENGSDQRLGKYLLKSQLGRGGMGVVYLATDLRLRRDVALKVLPRETSSNTDAVKRFLREARVAARLNHPNVVAIHDVDQQRGLCFLVMELLTGGTAQDMVQRGRLSWREATRITADACRGLAAIHEAGLIHRDIKPSNIMRAADGTVKLADFGLAKIADGGTNHHPLTQSGAILGTPQYMSPEQCQGDLLDARSDVYSLGATYYTLLTGQPLFSDPQPLQIMFAHCSKSPPDPRTIHDDIPPACVRIVLKALAKSRGDRFGSAREMLAELEGLLGTAQTIVSDSSPHDGTERNLFENTNAPTVIGGASAVIVPRSSDQTTIVKAPWKLVLKRNWLATASAGVIILLLIIGLAWRTWLGPTPAPSGGPTSTATTEVVAGGIAGPIALESESEFPGIDAGIRSVAFAPDNRSLFAGLLDGSVRQFEISPPREQRKFKGTTGPIHAVAVNRRWLAAGGDAKTIWLWDLNKTDQPPFALTDLIGTVSALAISPDGQRLAVGTWAEVRLYELGNSAPRLVKVLGTSTSGPVICYMVHSVAFSTDSRWLAAASWHDKTVAVWDAKGGELRNSISKQPVDPMAVAFLPGQDAVVFGLHDDGLNVWRIGEPTVRALSPQWTAHLRSFVLTPNGQSAVVVGEWDGPLHVYDIERERPPQVFKRSTSTSAVAVAISPDGTKLVSGGGEGPGRGYLHLWRVVPAKDL